MPPEVLVALAEALALALAEAPALAPAVDFDPGTDLPPGEGDPETTGVAPAPAEAAPDPTTGTSGAPEGTESGGGLSGAPVTPEVVVAVTGGGTPLSEAFAAGLVRSHTPPPPSPTSATAATAKSAIGGFFCEEPRARSPVRSGAVKGAAAATPGIPGTVDTRPSGNIAVADEADMAGRGPD